MLFNRDCKGLDDAEPWDHIYSKWLTKLFNFLFFSLFKIYCFLSFSYYYKAISFSSESLPSLIYMLSCSFIFCLRKSNNRSDNAYPYWLLMELLVLPYPKAIVLRLLTLSIVSYAIFFMFPLIDGIEVVGVTFGTSLFSST